MRQFKATSAAIAALVLSVGLPTNAAGAPATEPVEANEAAKGHLIERASRYSFDETVARLRAGIEKRPLKLFAEIDHAKGAASVDLELAPSTLFIFGNPKGGTPLMAKEPRMGLALPLKMHVFEAGGKVIVSYMDITALADRYGLDPAVQPIPNIAALLNGLASEATE